MGCVAVILLIYGFLASKQRPILIKIFYLQFGIVAATIDIIFIILWETEIVLEEEKRKFIAHFLLVTRLVFPASCLLFLRRLKDTPAEQDTLL
jgi:hypothetical protein